MQSLLRQHKYFFLLTIFYLIIGAITVIILPKGELEILINRHHTPLLDVLFQLVTYLGDGLFSVLIILILLIRKIYFGLVSAICLITTTLVTQSLKRIVFADTLRPSKFFESMKDLYYIEGLDIHSYFSFPSGHTSGAFTIFFFLAFITRRKYTDVLFFFIAFMVGLSRMYLMQHFFIDTYFGALIGISLTFIIFCLIEYSTQWKTNPLINRPLFSKK